MRPTTFFFMALAAFGAGQAQAQTITKSIGPDGRVIYSSQPPPGAASSQVLSIQTHPMRRSEKAASAEVAAQPKPSGPGDVSKVSAAPRPDPELRPMPTPVTAKKAARAEPALAAVPGPSAPAKSLDPTLEKAVIGALGIQDLIQQTEAICERALPTSFARYADAASGWDTRNRPLIAQARRAMGDGLDPTRRQALEAGLKARNEASLKPVIEAPLASKIKWCDQSADSFANGSMDIAKMPNLAGPLTGYRP